jgi:hypothetical protein
LHLLPIPVDAVSGLLFRSQSHLETLLLPSLLLGLGLGFALTLQDLVGVDSLCQ